MFSRAAVGLLLAVGVGCSGEPARDAAAVAVSGAGGASAGGASAPAARPAQGGAAGVREAAGAGGPAGAGGDGGRGGAVAPARGALGGNGGAGAAAVAAAGSGGASPAAGSVGASLAAGSGGVPAAAPQAGASGPTTAATPDATYLVAATGPCPELRDGYVMFNPDGVQRRVLLYMSAAASTLDGPLIFSWHSTLPNPEDTTSWIGRSVIEEIKDLGGIIAAPTTADSRATRPWDHTPLGPEDSDNDQRLMDEIVACAQSEVGIDLRHIHAVGMSAGGLKTAQVSLRRSGYLASVVVYSGGLIEGDMPPDQAPDNKLAAMILYGGRTDISPVDGIPYTAASTRYRDLLRTQGRFAFLCDHGGGHTVPQDSQASAWRFMRDHPFGTQPSPYATMLPSDFLSYCSLD